MCLEENTHKLKDNLINYFDIVLLQTKGMYAVAAFEYKQITSIRSVWQMGWDGAEAEKGPGRAYAAAKAHQDLSSACLIKNSIQNTLPMRTLPLLSPVPRPQRRLHFHANQIRNKQRKKSREGQRERERDKPKSKL